MKFYYKYAVILLFWSLPFSGKTQIYEIDTIQYQGDVDQFINLIILPDGFTVEEMGNFNSASRSFVDALFQEPPFADYRPYFNIMTIQVPSSESGASHPGTATDVDEPLIPVKTVNNVFGSTFDYFDIHRLLVPVNNFQVNSVLANHFPAYDQVVILVNSPFYGGSGGVFATSSVERSANEIAIHELGHSFANLADEYYAGDVYAREAANMTRTTDPVTVKWTNWMGINGIGIYQHCCSETANQWYRPHQSCKMRYLNNPFCAVCRQEIIETIHRLVDPILTYTPENDVAIIIDSIIQFKVSTIKPIPNSLNQKWVLNGEIMSHSDTFIVDVESLPPGNSMITYEVEDQNPMLRINDHHLRHLSVVSWEISKLSTGSVSTETEVYRYKLIPNPAQEKLSIVTETPFPQNTNISVVDGSGKIIIEKKVSGQFQDTIELEALLPGLYYLVLKNGEHPLFTRKFLKQ